MASKLHNSKLHSISNSKKGNFHFASCLNNRNFPFYPSPAKTARHYHSINICKLAFYVFQIICAFRFFKKFRVYHLQAASKVQMRCGMNYSLSNACIGIFQLGVFSAQSHFKCFFWFLVIFFINLNKAFPFAHSG